MAMGGEEALPLGVKFRPGAKKPKFEARVRGGKLCTTKINSVAEGALCYDIAKRYDSESDWAQGPAGGERGKRKAPLQLNYPDFSTGLMLEDLPQDFDFEGNKDELMALILRQAQAAARNLPEQARAAPRRRAKIQKPSPQDVGNQISNDRGSRQQNGCNSLVRGAKGSLEASKDTRGHLLQCECEYGSKIREREELEQKVKDMKEDLGIISPPSPRLEQFYEHMASLKQLLGMNGHFPLFLEAFEQEYKSEESKCWELHKILADHNSKSISESLMIDGNRMTGFQRANEQERLPPVQEACPIEEQNTSNMSTEVSASCVPPTIPLVLDVVAYGENGIAVPSVMEMDMSHPIASLGDWYPNDEIQNVWYSLVQSPTPTSSGRESGDGRLADICVNDNAEVQSDGWDLLDWTKIDRYNEDLT